MNGAKSVVRDAGQTMHQAGRAMIDAGAALRDASARMVADAGMQTGESMKDAGHAMRDAAVITMDAAGHNLDAAQAQAVDTAPNPRWILRDKTGNAIQAQASPYNPAARFTEDVGTCVYVGYLDKRWIGLSYDLSTGALDSCPNGSSFATWHDARPYFLDSTCQGATYAAAGTGIVRVGTSYYFADSTHRMRVAAYWAWNSASSTCDATAPASAVDIWSYTLVPSEFVSLRAAPYTLVMTY
jgi:hypothetical protein